MRAYVYMCVSVCGGRGRRSVWASNVPVADETVDMTFAALTMTLASPEHMWWVSLPPPPSSLFFTRLSGLYTSNAALSTRKQNTF